MKQGDEKLYEGRLYLFGIPLWKVKMTKREWLTKAFMMSTKKKILECVFLEEE